MAADTLGAGAPSRFECGFLGIDEHGIAGFARDRRSPEAPVDVELLVPGEPVELTRVDAPARMPPEAAGVFHFRLTRIPRLPCEIIGRVAGLGGSFGTLRIETREDLANAVDPAIRYEGRIEELVRPKGRIVGWVLDRFKPKRRVRVTLRDWEEPLFAVKANLYRRGLELSGKGDGRCAFGIDLPVDLLDGHEHTLRVTIEDTNVPIPGGPVVLSAEVIRELFDTIVPWQEDVLRIELILERLDRLADRRVSAPKYSALRRELAALLAEPAARSRERVSAVTRLLDELSANKRPIGAAVRNFSEAFVLRSKKG